MKLRYPLIGLCVLIIAALAYVIAPFLSDFPHSFYSFSYGPFACGKDTLTIEEKVDHNYLEGVTFATQTYTFAGNKFESAFQNIAGDRPYRPAIRHFDVTAPETGVGTELRDYKTLFADDALDERTIRSFIACLEKHPEIYSQMRQNYDAVARLFYPSPVIGIETVQK